MLTKPKFGANNIAMKEKIDYDMLGIYELREYARRCGIARPTTKKRNKLIEELELLKQGKLPKEQLQDYNIKKGRPAKIVTLKNQNTHLS